MDNEKENERDTKRETGNMNGEGDEAAARRRFQKRAGHPAAGGEGRTRPVRASCASLPLQRDRYSPRRRAVHGGRHHLRDGCAVAGGEKVNTVSATINYLRAGKDTEKLVIEADVVKCGRTLAVVDAKVMDDKGALLVTTTMTFMIFRS